MFALPKSDLSVNSQFLQQQRATIFKNLFLFVHKNASLDTLTMANLSVTSLADTMATSIDHYLLDKQFATIDAYFLSSSSKKQQLDALNFVWQIFAYSCEFSKRFLMSEVSLRKQHEYFTFNYLIIDKIEDFLVKLVGKFAVECGLNASNQINLDLDVSQLLLPHTFKATCLTKSSYSMFLNEIWVNIFLDYFLKIFAKCGMSHNKAKHSANEDERNGVRAKKTTGESLSYLLKNSKLKLSKLSKFNKHATVLNASEATTASHKAKKAQRKKHQNQNFVIDLSICKKLICLIQKLFELNNSPSDVLQLVTNRSSGQIGESTATTPRSSVSTTPTVNDETNVTYHDLIEKLEASSAKFVLFLLLYYKIQYFL